MYGTVIYRGYIGLYSKYNTVPTCSCKPCAARQSHAGGARSYLYPHHHVLMYCSGVSMMESKNAAYPTVVKPSGNVTEMSFVHSRNACFPIFSSPFGNITEVIPVHL